VPLSLCGRSRSLRRLEDWLPRDLKFGDVP
jgi:hypothetical protein